MSSRYKGKNKIFKTIILLIVLIVVFITVIFFVMSGKVKEYSKEDFEGINMNLIDDGVYKGSEDGGIVTAIVEVTVKNHKIFDIKILEHNNGRGEKAEAITENIIEKNSVEVDSISGATLSSNVIKKAVWNALAGQNAN